MSAELMRLSAEPISVLFFSGSIRVRAPKERSGTGLGGSGDNAEHRRQVMDGSKNNGPNNGPICRFKGRRAVFIGFYIPFQPQHTLLSQTQESEGSVCGWWIFHYDSFDE